MVETLNPFVRSKRNSIVYNVVPTSRGWQVQALVPDRISTDDRIKVIDWFHAYRSTVHRQYPFWLTTFHTADHGYFLDILKADDPREMLSHAVGTGTAWQQIELDFGYAGR